MNSALLREILTAPWGQGTLLAASAAMPEWIPAPSPGLRGEVLFRTVDWLVESVAADSYALAYRRARDVLEGLSYFHPESRELAKLLAAEAVKRLRDAPRRQWEFKDRRELLQRNGYGRCQICGFPFSKDAKAGFLANARQNWERRDLVDLFQPRGVSPFHLRIEIDHKKPLAMGGPDDLENAWLLCGWCNRQKWAHSSLFDAGHEPVRLKLRTGQVVEAPRPFWVVRLLAALGKCETRGCEERWQTTQLSVRLRVEDVRPFPINLAVSCPAHDPRRAERIISAEVFGEEQLRS